MKVKMTRRDFLKASVITRGQTLARLYNGTGSRDQSRSPGPNPTVTTP